MDKTKQKPEKKGSGFLPTLVVIALLIILVGISLDRIQKDEKIIDELRDRDLLDNPTLLTVPNSWGSYTDDPSLLYFDGYIYNFGNTEAKGLEMVCIFNDLRGNELGELSEDIENIASQSYYYYSFDKSKPGYYNEDDITSSCVIERCEGNCTILDGIID